MVPRTVRAAKAIADTFTSAQLASYGNIIGPFYRGWSTNYMEYYTGLPVNAYGVNPGDPTPITYWVHSFTASNEPRWAQSPARLQKYDGIIPISAMYPRADSTTAPPIGTT